MKPSFFTFYVGTSNKIHTNTILTLNLQISKNSANSFKKQSIEKLINSPGAIDSGYRNEWMAIVVDASNNEVTLTKGDRICQIILSKVHEYEFIDEDKLPESERGLGGFGSTGKS